MSNRLIITNETIRDRKLRVSAIYEENRLAEVSCIPCGFESVLGNIYIARVKNIAQNLQAAFLEIGTNQTVYYSMKEFKDPIFVRQARKNTLTEGDELVVQVTKEAVKMKEPVVSTNITLSGRYAVLTSENKKIGISKKLTKEQGKHFRELAMAYASSEYGIIIRTNAAAAEAGAIAAELEELSGRFLTLTATCKYKTCYSCLYQTPPEYLMLLRNQNFALLDQIVTDVKEVYEDVKTYLEGCVPEALEKLRFYEDPMLSLAKLYSLSVRIEEALSKKIWLKSGAFLFIEHTEAFTVIDVNSGKNIKGKKSKNPSSDAYYLSVNLEAADEIARQLRLRNISGICIIDFINHKSEEADRELIRHFKRALEKDPAGALFVDMTKLGLVELTRKKTRRSLAEQVFCDTEG